MAEAGTDAWRWSGGMKAEEARRLKELEEENRKLKEIVAEKELDIKMLRAPSAGKLVSPSRKRAAVQDLQEEFEVSERHACESGRSAAEYATLRVIASG